MTIAGPALYQPATAGADCVYYFYPGPELVLPQDNDILVTSNVHKRNSTARPTPVQGGRSPAQSGWWRAHPEQDRPDRRLEQWLRESLCRPDLLRRHGVRHHHHQQPGNRKPVDYGQQGPVHLPRPKPLNSATISAHTGLYNYPGGDVISWLKRGYPGFSDLRKPDGIWVQLSGTQLPLGASWAKRDFVIPN